MTQKANRSQKVPWLGIYATVSFLLALMFIYRAVVPQNNSLYAALAVSALVLTLLLGIGQKWRNRHLYGDQQNQDGNRLHGHDRVLAIILTFSYLYAAGWMLSVFGSSQTSKNAHIVGVGAAMVTLIAIWAARDHWGTAQGGFGGIAGLALLRFATSGDRIALVALLVCALIVVLLVFAERRATRGRTEQFSARLK
jgi:hypothetical protein